MKLAEALIARAELQKEVARLETRMQDNAKVQEGDEPAEAVEKLMPQFDKLMDELEGLIVRINKTNNNTPFDGMSLADAIAKRDNIKGKLRAYRELYAAATITYNRYSNKEIKFVRCVDLVKLQKIIDGLSKDYRVLDTKMQGLNWTVDLLD